MRICGPLADRSSSLGLYCSRGYAPISIALITTEEIRITVRRFADGAEVFIFAICGSHTLRPLAGENSARSFAAFPPAHGFSSLSSPSLGSSGLTKNIDPPVILPVTAFLTVSV
jgi:hypothetical protein